MYRQIDGVAMDRHLGRAYQTYLLLNMNRSFLNKIFKPKIYCLYVGDILSLFHNKIDFQNFLTCYNLLQPSLKFTNEIETNNSLPFFIVLVTKFNNKFITSVYRKTTFTSQYIIGIRLDQNKVKLILLIC